MASIDIRDLKNNKVGEMDFDDEVFKWDVKHQLLHLLVRDALVRKRLGNAKTKGRSEVSGSTSKPWRQKGTGRARSGRVTSPVWVGGGVAFGPKPKNYRLRLNKKVRKAALRSALSVKYREGRLIVLDEFMLEGIKTRAVADCLKKLNAEDSLIVYTGENSNLDLSSRNLRNVKTIKSEGINVYDILSREKLVMTRDAVQSIVEVLA